ncbi:putative lipoprotein [Vibrio coralliirubri]|uniref:MalM family protein n=1 Tax=Vibrio coralliirubri TaxID=1516159 RepID=UPI00063097A7|nr:MalM family protein [Vibrio coralliirubri]CDU07616.1 putative lipoprotein [Vibrio coralliirubri]
MKLKSLVIIVAALTVSACSGIPEKELNTDFNDSACCSQLSALPMTQLSVPFHQQVIMDGHLPTLSSSLLNDNTQADSQRFPTIAYQISDTTESLSLLIRSYIKNDALFAPSIYVFDKQWRLLGQYRTNDFTYYPTAMQGLERIEASIALEPQRDNAQFIVVSADSTKLDSTINRIHPEDLYSESQQIIGNKQLPLTATLSNVGVIDVTASKSTNSAVLTLLAELGVSSNNEPETLGSKQVSQPSTQTVETNQKAQWLNIQKDIDQALNNNDIKQAAFIANQAAEQGMPEAKDYLLKQLAE